MTLKFDELNQVHFIACIFFVFSNCLFVLPYFQVQCLRRLELENQEAGERLEEVVKRGEALLEQVQASLADIAQSQLDMQGLVEARSPNNRNSYS